MSPSCERLMGWVGAGTALYMGCQQLTFLLEDFDLQALLFLALHMQVAVAFVSRRTAVSQVHSLRNWLVCGASIFCMYLTDLAVVPSEIFSSLGKIFTSLGCLLAITAFAALGKGFGILPAFRQLATSGPYRIVRHPIYTSYVLMDLGIGLSHPDLFNACVIGVDMCMLVLRLKVEEVVCLEASPRYSDYASRVRFRLVPGIY